MLKCNTLIISNCSHALLSTVPVHIALYRAYPDYIVFLLTFGRSKLRTFLVQII